METIYHSKKRLAELKRRTARFKHIYDFRNELKKAEYSLEDVSHAEYDCRWELRMYLHKCIAERLHNI